MYLNCKTYYSFRYGTFATEELVKAGVEHGASALALTNINSTCDTWDFVEYCQQQSIKPIVGVEIRNDDQFCFILIARNNKGFTWINDFLSDHLIREERFPDKANVSPFFDDMNDGFVIYAINSKSPDHLFANERIGVRSNEISKLFSIDIKHHKEKFIVLQPVTFQNKKYFNVHRLLRAIDKNIILSKLPVTCQANPDETFFPPSKIIDAFKLYTFIVTNTYQLVDECNITMAFHVDKNKESFTATKEDDRILLEKLALDGLAFRYKRNKAAKERVHSELKIINDLGFNAYFLIAWDLIRYARSRGFYYVGRGSGANSIVAYCLLITDVDPIELNLYFERFLNPHRTSPPDFDIDFSWLDRDEMFDYVFKRYGRQHVAMLGMYSTFKYRAVVRELGKVFGLPKEEIDQLADNDHVQDNIHKLILQYGKLIMGFPNYGSVHPGGILISEKPMSNYTTLFNPPKGFLTAQLDMFVAENIGLYKLDILSQRGLGHIKEALRLIQQNHQIDINIHDVEKFKRDAKVCNKIREANTIGCFYIESPAMRQLLKKLRCSDYLTLVAASSIIRPGVAESGMMKEYIFRYHNPGKFQYLHPIMKDMLEETFGVMVFQEDVIKVAHYFAGLDLGEADILRRAMSGKYRSNNQFLLIKQRFFEKCKEKGHPDELSAEVWRQMESFAGYSFNKAHSASFAVESFQSLYLKTYYPKEFMVAVINNFGGFYSRQLYFLELMKTGANVLLPCVNNSEYNTNIVGNDVYTGFVHLKSFEKKLAELIIDERERGGTYLHLQDFIERTGTTKEQLNILISIGALRFTGKTKKALLWEATALLKHRTVIPGEQPIFDEAPIHFELPELVDDPIDDAYDELEILEFPLRNPFEIVNDDAFKYQLSKNLPDYLGKQVTMLLYFIDYKVVPTKNGGTMCFGTFFDAELNWVDTVHFPPSFARYPLKGQKGFYKITGKVVAEFDVYSVEVNTLFKCGYKKSELLHGL